MADVVIFYYRKKSYFIHYFVPNSLISIAVLLLNRPHTSDQNTDRHTHTDLLCATSIANGRI